MSGHLMWGSPATALAQLDMLHEDGMRVVRFDASWRNMEPQRGQYKYLDKLDDIVAAAVARGIAPLITVVETPDWANGSAGLWVPPSNPKDYANFVGMLAQRYAGQVIGWEIWNEPDIPLFWKPRPDPKAYAKLLMAASAAVRAADPESMVVGGSITFGNIIFLDALYDAGAKGSFDALSLHPYTLTHAPDDKSDRYHSLTAILDDAHAALIAHGDADIPMWVTEFGWAVVGLNSVSERSRIDYLGRTVEIIRARPWVQVLTIYTIDVRDSQRYGLSSDGVRSAGWRAYVDALGAK